MKVKSESEVTQSCPTLSDPMDCRPPGSSIYGIFQARLLEWAAIAFSKKQYGPTEIEYNKKRWQEYTEELYKKGEKTIKRRMRAFLIF